MENKNLDSKFETTDLALAVILKQAGLSYTIDRREERRVFYGTTGKTTSFDVSNPKHPQRVRESINTVNKRHTGIRNA